VTLVWRSANYAHVAAFAGPVNKPDQTRRTEPGSYKKAQEVDTRTTCSCHSHWGRVYAFCAARISAGDRIYLEEFWGSHLLGNSSSFTTKKSHAIWCKASGVGHNRSEIVSFLKVARSNECPGLLWLTSFLSFVCFA
jgi:hypothetical protein